MPNKTQLDRYLILLDYLAEHFIEEITPELIEDVCFYSYRNINRIFHALRSETIGQHITRLKLEKAAEYLMYSNCSSVDIAQAVGYADSASFSKAFKKRFGTAPSHFREKENIMSDSTAGSFNKDDDTQPPLDYEVKLLPEMRVLYCQYTGSYGNIKSIMALWNQLIAYGIKKNALRDNTIYLGEILDDNVITDDIYCRYNASASIPASMQLPDEGYFKTKTIPAAHYAVFTHHGSDESMHETYTKIYTQWMHNVQLEFADRATLEIYLNHDDNIAPADQLTEICIPVRSK